MNLVEVQSNCFKLPPEFSVKEDMHKHQGVVSSHWQPTCFWHGKSADMDEDPCVTNFEALKVRIVLQCQTPPNQ